MQYHRCALRMLLLSVFLVKMRVESTSLEKSVRPSDMEAIESSFLSMLGLKSRPRPRRQVRVPEYMLDLYRYRTAQATDPKALAFHLGKTPSFANTVRSFVSKEMKNYQSKSGSNHLFLWFNVSSLPQKERLKASEMRLYRPRLQGAHRSCFKGLHMQVLDVLSRPGEDTLLRLIDTRPVNVRDAGWESFDVLPAVLRWLEDPSNNHGLQVRLVRDDGSEGHSRFRRTVSRTMTAQSEDRQPLLVTYSDDGSAAAQPARSKRSPRKHRRKGQKVNCRRHSLYVDFSDVGWNDWIVAPPGYQAYYCNGECPFPLADHLNSTNHAIVQTLMNSVHQRIVPRACCVPTELSAISMLYVDEYDKVVLKNYQDMVVEGCGCR